MAAEAATVRVDNPSYQAFQVLHIAFTVAPIVAGADKFFHFLTNWEVYLAPIIPNLLRISAHSFMLAVGIVEMMAGLLVAVAPRFGGWVVGFWLCGIIVNLLMMGSYFDIALRDLGLALGAFALARLSVDFSEI
jgi:hypothetical protein